MRLHYPCSFAGMGFRKCYMRACVGFFSWNEIMQKKKKKSCLFPRPQSVILPFCSHTFTYLSIFNTCCFFNHGVGGLLTSVTAVIVRKQGDNLDKSPVHHRVAWRQTAICTHIHNLQFPIDLASLLLDSRWKLEKPQRHRERMQTPHRKAQRPRVLTTMALCCSK